MTGRLLGGRYRVTGPLGRGGMGVVCRAVDEVLGREVAVKVLRAFTDASTAELADLRTRMQREARAAARIRHAGVVTVHDVIDEDGRPVIIMELIEGSSLDDLMRQRGTLDPREAAGIGAQVMDALDAAHQAGVLHRDIKPGNILLDRAGRVVITDFGIASIQAPDDGTRTHLTRSGQLVGSLDYLPPERAQDLAPGPASDIWSLGMTLYAVVEGAAPFRRTSVWSTLTAIVSEPLPEPRRAGALAPVLHALMTKDPAARPSAAEARDMLQAVAEGHAPLAGDPPRTPTERDVRAAGATPPPGFGPAPAAPETGRRRRRVPLLAAAVAAVLLTAGVATYALLTPNERPTATPGPHDQGKDRSKNPSAAPSASSTATATTTASAPAPCASATGGRYHCEVWRPADTYTKDFDRAGTLNAGTSYFYCQADLGRRETYGRWTNVWWARTDDDNGNTGVYVSVVYLKGGDNDEPVPGLPTC
ncbi:serine/threonine-protein kinase [Streptomyces sp. NPDC050315]|uniref:serine/threonine-protein kinase n=1 Tax=Streptomyces sp. NPDC050315 TaxID=3155039 RepID=UPI00344630FD